MSTNINPRIQALIQAGVGELNNDLREWVHKHLVEPYAIQLRLDPDRPETDQFWIVTDHVGSEDSSCRVAFNPRTNAFGLECTLEDGRHWYMGDCGALNEAVENM